MDDKITIETKINRGVTVINKINKRIIGANLRRLRKKKGLKPDEVASELKLKNRETVYRYEQGTADPPGSRLVHMMRMYQCNDISELCRPEEDNND